MKVRVLLVTAISLCLVACSRRSAPQPPQRGPIITSPGGATGYQHGLEGSRFALGDHVRRTAELRFNKYVGNEGTFGIDITNGSVLALPKANAKSLQLPPYGHTSQEHDTFVKDYFVSLGIPPDQIASVHTAMMLEAHGTTGDAKSPQPKIVAYYSGLDRAVDGIPVPDSFAWARVNSAGQVVAEAVYWPAISPNVLSDARKLKDVLSDPQRQQAYDAKLPAGFDNRDVAIHHSSATVESDFRELAAIDVSYRVRAPKASSKDENEQFDRLQGMSVMHHLGIDGRELRLPQETRNIGKDTPKKAAVGR